MVFYGHTLQSVLVQSTIDRWTPSLISSLYTDDHTSSSSSSRVPVRYQPMSVRGESIPLLHDVPTASRHCAALLGRCVLVRVAAIIGQAGGGTKRGRRVGGLLLLFLHALEVAPFHSPILEPNLYL